MVQFPHKVTMWLQKIWNITETKVKECFEKKGTCKCTFAFASLGNVFLNIKTHIILYGAVVPHSKRKLKLSEQEGSAFKRKNVFLLLTPCLVSNLQCKAVLSILVKCKTRFLLKCKTAKCCSKLIVLVTWWYFIFTWLVSVSAGLPSKGVALAAHYTHRERTESPLTLKHKQKPVGWVLLNIIIICMALSIISYRSVADSETDACCAVCSVSRSQFEIQVYFWIAFCSLNEAKGKRCRQQIR